MSGELPTDPVVLRPPLVTRLLLTLAGGFFVWALGLSVANPSLVGWEGVAAPGWLGWLVLVLLAVVGVYALLLAWRRRVLISADQVTSVSVLGRRNTVTAHDTRRVQVVQVRETLPGASPVRYDSYRVAFFGPQDVVLTRSELSDTELLLQVAVSWSRRRPGIVQDSDTRSTLQELHRSTRDPQTAQWRRPVPPPLDRVCVAATVTGWLGLGPVAVVLGAAGLWRVHDSGARGRGFALAGLALGVVSTLVWALVLV